MAGSWDMDASLRKTSQSYFGSGDDSDQPPIIRFVKGVARLTKKRLRSDDKPSSDASPAVFLLRGELPDTFDEGQLTSHPMLDNGLTPTEGCLWLVGPLVNYGKAMSVSVGGDAELFGLVVETGLGEFPAIIFDHRVPTPLLRLYEGGLIDPESVKLIAMPEGMLSFDQVVEVIQHIYDRTLKAPGGQEIVGRLWQDATKHWPVQQAELTVQLYLTTAFHAAFPWCRVVKEQPDISGRTDIEIEEMGEPNASVWRHVLLELKVLRDFGSTGSSHSEAENLERIERGLEQAYAYAQEKGFATRALCCFDMRVEFTGNDCFEHVRERAETLKVHTRCWHIFADAESMRMHETPA